MISATIDEYVHHFGKKENLPFTVQVISFHDELKTDRFYTVTKLFIECGMIMADVMEHPVPVVYIPEQFQIVVMSRPN